MPQFSPGETKTAVAPIVAKPSGMNCEAELFLGPDDATKVVSSGRVPFVSTGAAKNVNLPITMPGSPGSYHGYIDVFAGGLRFLSYILKEDVVVQLPPAAQILGLDWYMAQPFPPNQSQRLTIRMKNLAPYPYTYTLDIFNDGVPIANASFLFEANQTREHTIGNIAIGGAGTHSLAARLSYGSNILHETSALYTVAEVVVQYAGTIGGWLIWYEGLSSWQLLASGKVIPVNTVVEVAIQWTNRSPVSARGHIGLGLIAPPGYPTTLSAVLNQDKSASPGDGWYVQFAPVALTEIGNYLFRASLSVENILAAQQDLQIIVT